MFAKVFSQIYDSSIVEHPEVRFTFMDFLILADANGVVDITHDAIARRTNRPIELIRNTIAELESDDSRSRSPDFNGARIKRLDDHRDWGWMIVNYDKFRKIASGEQKRERTLARVRKHRANNDLEMCNDVKRDVTLVNACNAKQKQKQKEKKESTVSAEQIYSHYPRKVGKRAALLAISKAMSKMRPADLLRITLDYAAARKACEERYTPHASTWFNQERYDDPPESWKNGEDSKPKQQWCGPL